MWWIIRRKDGEAIWRDQHLYAQEDKPTGVTPETAHRFALAFADSVVVLGKGRVRWSGPAASFRESPDAQAWLAV